MVVEDLHSGAQQHWLGHPEEISTLALSHDAQVPALRNPRRPRVELPLQPEWARGPHPPC